MSSPQKNGFENSAGSKMDSMQMRTKEERSSTVASSTDDESDIECEVCNKTFSRVKEFQQHLSSKNHHKMIQKRKLLRKNPDLLEQLVEGIRGSPGDDDDLENFSSKYKCDICKKAFSGIESYKAHMKSNVHTKNVRKQKLTEKMKDMPEVLQGHDGNVESEDDILQKPFSSCSACSKAFSGPEGFQQHLKSEAHRKKLKAKKLLDERLKAENIDSLNDEESFYKCETCEKSFSGIVPYEIHMRSGVHRRIQQKAEVVNEINANFGDNFTKDPELNHYVCKECEKTFSDPLALKSHLENNSHEKHKFKMAIFDFVSANPEIAAVKSIQTNSSDDEENTDLDDAEKKYKIGSYFLVCKVCHTSFSGPESARDHVRSKRHKKITEEQKNMKMLKKKMKENSVNGKDNVKKSSEVDGTTSVEDKSTRDGNGIGLKTDEDFELL